MMGARERNWERMRTGCFARLSFLRMKQLSMGGKKPLFSSRCCCAGGLPLFQKLFYRSALWGTWGGRAKAFSQQAAAQMFWWRRRTSAHGTSTCGLTMGSTSGPHRSKVQQLSSANHEALAVRFSRVLPSSFSPLHGLLGCAWSLHAPFHCREGQTTPDGRASVVWTHTCLCAKTPLPL